MAELVLGRRRASNMAGVASGNSRGRSREAIYAPQTLSAQGSGNMRNDGNERLDDNAGAFARQPLM
jgi:hypothetical protein